jgi:hypothetical protein
MKAILTALSEVLAALEGSEELAELYADNGEAAKRAARFSRGAKHHSRAGNREGEAKARKAAADAHKQAAQHSIKPSQANRHLRAAAAHASKVSKEKHHPGLPPGGSLASGKYRSSSMAHVNPPEVGESIFKAAKALGQVENAFEESIRWIGPHRKSNGRVISRGHAHHGIYHIDHAHKKNDLHYKPKGEKHFDKIGTYDADADTHVAAQSHHASQPKNEDTASDAMPKIIAKRAKDIHKAAKRVKGSMPSVAGDFYHGSAAHHLAAARLSTGHRRSQEVRAARVAHKIARSYGKKGRMGSKRIIDVNRKAIPKGYGVA